MSEGNGKLKRLVADLSLDGHILQEIVQKSCKASPTARAWAIDAGRRRPEWTPRGEPQSITADNGSEFAGKVMDGWTYQKGVRLEFIRPRKPVDNGELPMNGAIMTAVSFESIADS